MSKLDVKKLVEKELSEKGLYQFLGFSIGRLPILGVEKEIQGTMYVYFAKDKRLDRMQSKLKIKEKDR